MYNEIIKNDNIQDNVGIHVQPLEQVANFSCQKNYHGALSDLDNGP